MPSYYSNDLSCILLLPSLHTIVTIVHLQHQDVLDYMRWNNYKPEDFYTPNATVSSTIQQAHSDRTFNGPDAPQSNRSPAQELSNDLLSVKSEPPQLGHDQCHFELTISAHACGNLSNSKQVTPIKANEPAPGQVVAQHLRPTTVTNLH